jgi:hypothetical protein
MFSAVGVQLRLVPQGAISSFAISCRSVVRRASSCTRILLIAEAQLDDVCQLDNMDALSKSNSEAE